MKKIILLLILAIFVVGCAKQIETPIEEPQQLPIIQEKGTIEEMPKEEKAEEIQEIETQETGTKETQKSEIAEEKPKETQTNWPTFHRDKPKNQLF